MSESLLARLTKSDSDLVHSPLECETVSCSHHKPSTLRINHLQSIHCMDLSLTRVPPQVAVLLVLDLLNLR